MQKKAAPIAAEPWMTQGWLGYPKARVEGIDRLQAGLLRAEEPCSWHPAWRARSCPSQARAAWHPYRRPPEEARLAERKRLEREAGPEPGMRLALLPLERVAIPQEAYQTGFGLRAEELEDPCPELRWRA